MTSNPFFWWFAQIVVTWVATVTIKALLVPTYSGWREFFAVGVIVTVFCIGKAWPK